MFSTPRYITDPLRFEQMSDSIDRLEKRLAKFEESLARLELVVDLCAIQMSREGSTK